MTDYNSYATPPSSSSFSKQFFQNVSIEELVTLQYPAIAAKHSVDHLEWSTEVPRSAVATTLMAHDVIPDVADLSSVFEVMRDQFHAGYRSLVVHYRHEEVEYQYCFHFLKINLIKLVNNYDKPRKDLGNLLRYLDSPCVSELGLGSVILEFRRCKFLEGLSGFAANRCPLHKLASLLGEQWVDQDTLDALLELDYFRSHAKSTSNLRYLSPSAPVHIILPTDFLLDAIQIYHSSGTVGLDSFPAGRLLRCRIASTLISSVSICRIQDDHYTAITLEVGSGALKYGDSMHGPIPLELGTLISRVLSTSSLQVPITIEQGVIALQGGASGGEGSCGLAALNFIQQVLDLNTPHWRGSQSNDFRTIALLDLIRFHCIARNKVHIGEDFHTHWARPASPQVADALAALDSAAAGPEYFGSCYQDFNLYSPTAAHPIHSLLKQEPTPWPMKKDDVPTASFRATCPQPLEQSLKDANSINCTPFVFRSLSETSVCGSRCSIPQVMLFGSATRLGVPLDAAQHGARVACTADIYDYVGHLRRLPLVDLAGDDTIGSHSCRCKRSSACPGAAPIRSYATDVCILISNCPSVSHPMDHEQSKTLYDVPTHFMGQQRRRRRYEPRSWLPPRTCDCNLAYESS